MLKSSLLFFYIYVSVLHPASEVFENNCILHTDTVDLLLYVPNRLLLIKTMGDESNQTI